MARRLRNHTSPIKISYRLGRLWSQLEFCAEEIEKNIRPITGADNVYRVSSAKLKLKEALRLISEAGSLLANCEEK